MRLPRTPAYPYGLRLRVSGLLQTPPVYEDFDYRSYLARQGIYSILEYPHAVPMADDTTAAPGPACWRSCTASVCRASSC